MPSYKSDLFNIEPYYDDFDETKNYHKLLFRPGYSVQARELSQLQTVLQNQVERLGNHVFKDGSKVYGAESAVQTVDYIKVTTDNDFENFIGYEISQTNEDVTSVAKVIHAETINEEKYFFVQVVRGSLFTSGTLTSNITGISATATVVSTGSVKLFSVSEGIFFIDGFFVRTGQQYAPNITSTGTINSAGVFGFDINRNYIGSNNDTTLLDPARGSYNFNAPGADRYQLDLDLSFFESDERDDFVPLAIIDSDGNITYQSIYSDYSELEKTLARRTYDESGSYIVDPFELDLLTNTNDSKITLGVGAGKAYLFGYEFENQATQFIDLDKARETESIDTLTEQDSFSLGSYFEAPLSAGSLPEVLGTALASSLFKEPISVSILNDANEQVGSAKLLSVQNAKTSSFLRFYLTDVNGGFSNPSDSYKLGLGTSPITESSLGNNFFQEDNQSLLFPVNAGPSIKKIKGLEVRQRESASFGSVDGLGEVNLSSLGLNSDLYSFVGTNDTILDKSFVGTYYHVFRQAAEGGTTQFVSPNDYDMTKSGGLLRIQGLADGTYTILTTVQFSATDIVDKNDYTGSIRQKTLREETFTVDGSDIFTDETGRSYILLNHADIIKINSITIAEGDPRFEDDTNVGTSVITDFTFDNGQRDYIYEYGRLYFTRSKESSYQDENDLYTFRLTVNYEYFEHVGRGFITPDSYPVDSDVFANGDTFLFGDIPLFTSERTGKTFSLSSCIDFRYVKDTAREEDETVDVTPNSTIFPAFQTDQTRENDVMKISHEFYLPRIDKLVLRRDFNEDETKFELIKGKSSLFPEAPADKENSLTLYKLILPAYTHNDNDVEVEGVSHRRYTMREIGEVDKRLENVEVFSSLSNIESKIDAISFVQTDGSELEKKAILVDDFSGHGIGDVSNPDYRCSVDFQNKELRPSFEVYNYDTTIGSVQGDLTQHPNGVITAKVDAAFPNGITFASQPKATESISVNPYQLTNWVGSISTNNKEFDLWFDDQTRPVVKTNTKGENDAWLFTSYEDTKVGFGTQWNDWEAIWSGVGFDKKSNESRLKNLLSIPKSNESLNSIRSHLEKANKIDRTTESIEDKIEEVSNKLETFPDHITKVLRDKVVDLSVVPYMRSRSISIDVDNLKPNTTVTAFIDNESVADNITGSLVTDDAGKLRGLTLNIPNEKFLSGRKVLRFTDSDTNPTTIAETVLTSRGIFENRDQGVSSVRPLIRRRQDVTDSSFATDVNTRKNSTRITKKYQWLDPLSQTFYVDESEYPRGLFIQNLDLYFQKKDSTLPVTVQIRPTKNGRPHPSAIIPFSEVVLYPDDINVNENLADTKTTVTFPCPIFLEPGEYAICLISNSMDHRVYTATVGETELGGTDRIQKQVYSGKLFRPQNTNISDPDYTKDLTFCARRCSFVTGGDKTFVLEAKDSGSSHKVHLSRLLSYGLTPNGTSTEITYSLNNNLPAKENQNIVLQQEKILSGTTSSFSITLSNTEEVSPVFDTNISSVIHIENIMNDGGGDLDTRESLPTTEFGSNARYITKRVQLKSPADRIRVFLDMVKVIDNSVSVYAKVRTVGSNEDFDSLPYVKLNLSGEENFSSDQNDIITQEFRSNTINDFDLVAIKIVMTGEDALSVPRIKGMRMVSLA